MFAVIETGGKQISVNKDDIIYVEKLDQPEGQEVIFDKVLFANGNFGKPYIEGASVKGLIEKQGKQAKINVIRYRAKSNLRRSQGHRQPYTRVKILEINA